MDNKLREEFYKHGLFSTLPVQENAQPTEYEFTLGTVLKVRDVLNGFHINNVEVRNQTKRHLFTQLHMEYYQLREQYDCEKLFIGDYEWSELPRSASMTVELTLTAKVYVKVEKERK